MRRSAFFASKRILDVLLAGLGLLLLAPLLVLVAIAVELSGPGPVRWSPRRGIPASRRSGGCCG